MARIRHPLGSVPYHNADWLREQLITHDRTYQEIADEFGVKQNTIGYFAKKFGIDNPHGAHQRRGVYGREKHRNWQGGKDKYTSAGDVGWKAASGDARKRANNTCQRCGKQPKSGRALDVHHKDDNRQNNADDNLIVLCRSCHNKEHGKIPPQQRARSS